MNDVGVSQRATAGHLGQLTPGLAIDLVTMDFITSRKNNFLQTAFESEDLLKVERKGRTLRLKDDSQA